jgi:diguanylate cyclase (GGDEF)-like protein/PAS domain S-box-containing protein
MSIRRRPFTGRRLLARFRWAAVLMLLPLVGVTAAAAAAIGANIHASGALAQATALGTQVDVTDQHVEDYALSALTVLVGNSADDVAPLDAAEATVSADLAKLGSAPGLTQQQRDDLPAADAAWTAMLGDRVATHALGASQALDAGAATLADAVLADVARVDSKLVVVQSAGASNIASLQRERDSAEQLSAVSLGVTLLIGLAIAALVSRRLALSIVGPIDTLRQATRRLAAGELSHRLATGGGDEIADLGADFNTMAAQLEDEREAVHARERRLTALVANASDGILVVGGDGLVSFVTPSFRAFVDERVLATTQLAELVHPEDVDRVRAAWVRAVAGGEGSTLEVEARLKRRDGDWRHVWTRLTNRFADPAVAGMVFNVSDVSERHEHEAQLTFQGLHDALTGLPNRELFRQRLERAAATAGSAFTSVLYVDFDDFKRVNDSLGHSAGDSFLVAMAARLTESVRPQDTVGRIGGDEFVVLLEGANCPDAEVAARRVLAALQLPLTIDGKDLSPGASVGLASALAGTASPETLLADADAAMYFAKRNGKAQYRVFSQEMRSDLLERLQLDEDLRAAVDAGSIQVHYQPIVDMQTGVIVGAEALARWDHPTRGWIGPALFIPLAEELGLARRIDAAVLRAACSQGRAWEAAGLAALRMSVNLSGTNLDSMGLVGSVAEILEDTGFRAANLELELTEGVAVADSDGVRDTLESLKSLGVHLSIDDFGTGYSALSRLQSLPFDTLKVDKVFVDELDAVDPGSTLAGSILDMARVLGLRVIAEGVETATQADFLRHRGCDLAQGYLYSRPVTPAAFETLLAGGVSLDPRGGHSAVALSA